MADVGLYSNSTIENFGISSVVARVPLLLGKYKVLSVLSPSPNKGAFTVDFTSATEFVSLSEIEAPFPYIAGLFEKVLTPATDWSPVNLTTELSKA